ncbi:MULTISPECIES: lysostaphin resistance A-like protein [unclassified Jeotgalibaca]|uniref:lysostaphin resistance A-like protein n=1 Tax=unclassified Jeotgalibaca TaxID=2621505 RepID=UPI003FD4BD64
MSMTLTILFAFIGTVAMIIVNYKEKWSPEAPIIKRPSAPMSKVIGWSVLGFIGSLVIQTVTSIIESLIFGVTPESANTQNLLELTTAYPLLIFMITIFAPVMEEFVFRKAVFTQLNMSRVGLFGSAVISALIFAFIHFDGHMLVYGTLGLWFSYLYYKTNNIFTPMLAHGLMNAFASLPIFFPELLG